MSLFQFLGQSLELLPEKVVFWREKQILLIADTHFGKVTHFRKSGISIPDGAALQNLNDLDVLIQKTRPKRVIFLGDLFHSEMNSEWLLFKKLLQKHSEVEFTLVQGNHDIFHEFTYSKSQFELVNEVLEIGPFVLSHEPLEEDHALYNLCGHLHPGVRLQGEARQALRLPCFYFGEKQGILPAFGEFTGLYIIKPKRKDPVFVVADGT